MNWFFSKFVPVSIAYAALQAMHFALLTHTELMPSHVHTKFMYILGAHASVGLDFLCVFALYKLIKWIAKKAS